MFDRWSTSTGSAATAIVCAGVCRIDGAAVSVFYLRAGYTPDDYPSASEWDARRKMESCCAASCPSVAYQLVGAKKIQQDLASPGTPFLGDPLPVDPVWGAALGRLVLWLQWCGESAKTKCVHAQLPIAQLLQIECGSLWTPTRTSTRCKRALRACGAWRTHKHRRRRRSWRVQ